MKKYFKIWLRLLKMRFRELYIESRINSAFLLSGKITRFSFFLFFIVVLLLQTKNLAGFSLFQMILFYMTFNLVDITSQFFARGIYGLNGMINKGQIDLFLTQPISAIFRIFSDLLDLLDLATLVPTIALLTFVIFKLETPITLFNFLLYILLVFNALIIAFSIHLLILSISLITQEVTSGIWVYRDLMTMGRFPVDIFSKPIQLALTFLIPIAVMITFPAKVLLGILSPIWVLTALIIGLIFLAANLLLWKQALKNYTSISV